MATIQQRINTIVSLPQERTGETQSLVDEIRDDQPTAMVHLQLLVNVILAHGEEVNRSQRFRQVINALAADPDHGHHDQARHIIRTALESQHLQPDPLKTVVDATIASPLAQPRPIERIIDTITETAHGPRTRIREILTAIVHNPAVGQEKIQKALNALGSTDAYFEKLMREAWDSAHNLHVKNFVALVSHRNVLQHAVDRLRHRPSKDLGWRVSIAEMQRMQLRALQIALVKTASELQLDGNSMEINGIGPRKRFGATLARLQAAEAVRDYEYMIDVSQGRFDCFIASSERQQDNLVLKELFDDKKFQDLADRREFEIRHRTAITDDDMVKDAIPVGRWNLKDREPLGGTRNATAQALFRQAFLLRLISASMGAVFLIGPMWLLTLRRELYVNLGAATGFIAAFGLLMVALMDKVENVFAATLAYAAVIMVFVGVMFDKQFTG